jgi:two-component system sensor histidine kinase RegB
MMPYQPSAQPPAPPVRSTEWRSARDAAGLHWLIRIRWIALSSYLVILGIVSALFGTQVPVQQIVVILGAAALSNLALAHWKHRNTGDPSAVLGATLLLDIALVAAILYFTGGYTNPFSILFLAQVTLAALLLNARWTWGVFGAASAAFITLFFFNEPFSQLGVHDHAGHGSGFSLHLYGMLLAFIVVGLLIVLFVTRMQTELVAQAARIDTLQRRAERERILTGLATVAAGAAHELSTPIATLTLIADELAPRVANDPAVHTEIRAMQGQLTQCASILQRMRGRSSELPGEPPSTVAAAHLLSEVLTLCGAAERVTLRGVEQCDEPLFTLHESLRSSLSAILSNALQASPTEHTVELTVQQSGGTTCFTVRDTGHGMNAAERARVGEPFFTTKEPGRGMGLGLFLVRLYAATVGGQVEITSQVGHGTEVRLVIPTRMGIHTTAAGGPAGARRDSALGVRAAGVR